MHRPGKERRRDHHRVGGLSKNPTRGRGENRGGKGMVRKEVNERDIHAQRKELTFFSIRWMTNPESARFRLRHQTQHLRLNKHREDRS